jgi:hypothetical protein
MVAAVEVEEGGTYFAGGQTMAGFARRSSLKRHLNFMALLGYELLLLLLAAGTTTMRKSMRPLSTQQPTI